MESVRYFTFDSGKNAFYCLALALSRCTLSTLPQPPKHTKTNVTVAPKNSALRHQHRPPFGFAEKVNIAHQKLNDSHMKTIGLIGGMSWESTIPYYRAINERVKERLGGLHSAKIILYSVDFHEIERLQHSGDWDAAGANLARTARSLELAGAEFIVLCTNTMHKVASTIAGAVSIPLLHIAEPTALQIREAGHVTVGLLGTRFTMEQAFYRERLEEMGLKVLVPPEQGREAIHKIIYEELCLGKVLPESATIYQTIIADLAMAGAQAIILGCTEISMLVQQKHCTIPLFDTTVIHAKAAADMALMMERT